MRGARRSPRGRAGTFLVLVGIVGILTTTFVAGVWTGRNWGVVLGGVKPARPGVFPFFCDMPVITTTGIALVRASFLSAPNTSGPLIFGSNISSKMRSGIFSRATRNASSPSPALLIS